MSANLSWGGEAGGKMRSLSWPHPSFPSASTRHPVCVLDSHTQIVNNQQMVTTKWIASLTSEYYTKLSKQLSPTHTILVVALKMKAVFSLLLCLSLAKAQSERVKLAVSDFKKPYIPLFSRGWVSWAFDRSVQGQQFCWGGGEAVGGDSGERWRDSSSMLHNGWNSHRCVLAIANS